MKRILSVILILTILLCNLPSVELKAATKDDVDLALSSRVTELYNKCINMNSNTAAYAQLSAFTEYTIYILMYLNNPLQLGYAELRTSLYMTDYNLVLNNFNTHSSPVITAAGRASVSNAEDVEDIFISLLKYSEEKLGEYKAAAQQYDDDEKISAYYSSISVLISQQMQLYLLTQKAKQEMTAYDNSVHDATNEPFCVWLSESKRTEADDVLQDLAELNAEFQHYIVDVATSERDDTLARLNINDDSSVLEALFNAKQEDYGIGYTGSVALVSNELKAILAAESVYVPLVSKLGCDAYIQALRGLYGDDEEAADTLVQLYNLKKGYKKPLYKRSLSNTGIISSEGTLITIQEFVDAINSGESFALSSCKGKFFSNSNSGTWWYLPTKETVADGCNLAIAEITDGILTDEVMSKAFEATESKIDRNAFNQPILTITSKMANQQYNMAYIVMKNILTGVSLEKYLGNARMQYLYVNMFGDIVTQDDIVILPALANPIIYKYGDGSNLYMPYTAAFMNYYPFPIDSYSTRENEQGEQVERLLFSGGNNTGKIVLGGTTIVAHSNQDTAVPEDFDSLSEEEKLTVLATLPCSDADIQEAHEKLIADAGLEEDEPVIEFDDEVSSKEPSFSMYHQFYKYYAGLDNKIGLLPSAYKVLDAGQSLAIASITKSGAKLSTDDSFAAPLLSMPYFSKNGTTKEILVLKTYDLGDEENTIKKDNTWVVYGVVAAIGVVAGGPIGWTVAGVSALWAQFQSWIDQNAYEQALAKPYVNTAVTAMETDYNIEGYSVFPYDERKDSLTNYAIAKDLAYNAYKHLTDKGAGLHPENNFVFGATRFQPIQLDEKFYCENVLIAGIGGTADISSFVRSSALTYDKYVEEAPNRFYSFLKGISSNFLGGIDNTRGMLGLDDITTTSIFAKVFSWIKSNLAMILIVLAILLLLGFLRQGLSMATTIFRLIVTVAGAYLLLNIIPAYVPLAYNSVLNDLGNSMFYKILATEVDSAVQDNYSETDDGQFINRTASITLYRFSKEGIASLVKELGVPADTLSSGKSIIVDKNSGTYLEGDKLKMTTDALFSTVKASGKFKETTAGKVYQTEFVRTVSSNVDYYMPYYLILNSLTDRINTLIRIYAVPRSTIYYPSREEVMDCYMFKAYVNSAVFLAPNNFASLIKPPTNASSAEIYQYQAVVASLQNSFTRPEDWLGLTDILNVPDDNLKKTLWMQTMQSNGYYDANWNPDTEKLANLVEAVNLQTKEFVLENISWVDNLCDDTLIQIVTLYATAVFNAKISDYGKMVYPIAINYEDYAISDVLTATLLSETESQRFAITDVASQIMANHGWFALIIYYIDLIALIIITNIIKFMVPAVYLSLIVITACNVLVGKSCYRVFKGFFKSNLIAIGCLTFLNLIIVLLAKLDGSAVAVYVLFGCCILLLYILFGLVTAILSRFTELGDSSINVKAATLASKTHITDLAGAARNIWVRDDSVSYDEYSGQEQSDANAGFNEYSNRKSVAEVYGGNNNDDKQYINMHEEKLTPDDVMHISSSAK